jgi:signal transduction histidine kinase
MRGWYTLAWVVLGLSTGVVAVLDDPLGQRSPSLGVLGTMGLGYALSTLLPAHRWIRLTHLALLVPALGAMGYLPGGGASLLVLTLPQFWMFTRGPLPAVVLSGLASAGVVAGAMARSEGAFSGNALAATVSFALSVPIGAVWHQYERRTARLGDELERAQRELAEAHRREGAVRERDRLAREIHDTLAQGFASITALAEAARIASDPEQHDRHLASIEATARENLAEARVLVGAAPAAAAGSLTAALRHTLDRFAEDTGIAVDVDLVEASPGPHARAALLRCAQESLANVRKHASASTVTCVLAENGDDMELEITDDGRGFAVAEARGFGIDGMRRRLEELGGELTVTSSPGEGTRVMVVVPVAGEER